MILKLRVALAEVREIAAGVFITCRLTIHFFGICKAEVLFYKHLSDLQLPAFALRIIQPIFILAHIEKSTAGDCRYHMPRVFGI